MTSNEGQHIDGDVLASGLISGIHRVIGQQEYLNRINVFPVADSDTGTNLSLSLSSALGVLQGDPGKHLGTMLAAMADALLDGARGNSGAIIAQFFQGFSDSAGEITDWGYSVELGIPFSSLRFQRSNGTQIWGLNAVRGYPRTVSYQIWNAPYDRSNSCRVCQFVKIEGFEGVSPGRNLEINPTVTALQTKTRDDFPHGDFSKANREVDAGVTARWGMTPNMVLGGTVNPDFSHNGNSGIAHSLIFFIR